jgi:hypothetical protein
VDVLPRVCIQDFLAVGEAGPEHRVIHTRNLTSNVRQELCRARDGQPADPPIWGASRRPSDYSSSMCSNLGPADQVPRVRLTEADLATRLAAAIDELAAAATREQDPADSGLAERLARAWAIIVAADPELAARTARYSPS